MIGREDNSWGIMDWVTCRDGSTGNPIQFWKTKKIQFWMLTNIQFWMARNIQFWLLTKFWMTRNIHFWIIIAQIQRNAIIIHFWMIIAPAE